MTKEAQLKRAVLYDIVDMKSKWLDFMYGGCTQEQRDMVIDFIGDIIALQDKIMEKLEPKD